MSAVASKAVGGADAVTGAEIVVADAHALAARAAGRLRGPERLSRRWDGLRLHGRGCESEQEPKGQYFHVVAGPLGVSRARSVHLEPRARQVQVDRGPASPNGLKGRRGCGEREEPRCDC